MTDRELQDFFDRRAAGDGNAPEVRADGASAAPPGDAAPEDVAAYRVLYDALADPATHGLSARHLPDDFAERVADRVGLRPSLSRDRAPARPAHTASRSGSSPSRSWSDALPGLEAASAAGMLAALVVMALFLPGFGDVLHSAASITLGSLQAVTDTAAPVRTDVLGAASLALLLALLADRLFSHFRLPRRMFKV
jgi:hypothetical protein